LTWDGEPARVVSVNLGVVREVLFHGEMRTTAIWKEPVDHRVAVRTLGLAGDEQADQINHGGTGKAVYAYGAEDRQWWEAELGAPLSPGVFGENLSVVGIPINDSVIGERWRVGSAVLQVVQPRFPCWKLGLRMGDSRFTKRFLDAGRAGAYLSVEHEGTVAVGDPIELLSQPRHSLTVGLVAYLNHADRAMAVRLLDAVETGSGPGELDQLLLQSGVA